MPCATPHLQVNNIALGTVDDTYFQSMNVHAQTGLLAILNSAVKHPVRPCMPAVPASDLDHA